MRFAAERTVDQFKKTSSEEFKKWNEHSAELWRHVRCTCVTCVAAFVI